MPVKPNNQTNKQRHSPLASKVVLGTIFGLISAVAYTAANVCLRSVAHCDPIWVSCMKSLPTVVLVGPWLLARTAWGHRVLPPMKTLAMLALAGLFGQIAGNITFQWALGVVGIALTVPLTLGGMIVTGAFLGRVLLGEPVTGRTALSILVLILAVCVFSFGARDAQQSVARTVENIDNHAPTSMLVGGIAGAFLSGFAYSLLGVALRHGVTGDSSVTTAVFTVGVVGLLGLGSLSFLRLGWQEMSSTSGLDLSVMLMAGVCNAVAFLALTKALQVTSIVYVNALNATQAAMAAIVGVLWFNEALTGAMMFGVALSIGGLLLMKKSKPKLSIHQKQLGPDRSLEKEDNGGKMSGSTASETVVETEG